MCLFRVGLPYASPWITNIGIQYSVVFENRAGTPGMPRSARGSYYVRHSDSSNFLAAKTTTNLSTSHYHPSGL
jgi:hypothetical protein